MILTTHALVGAAIGEKISNPWIVIAASLAMHFFLDTFRHGEYLNQKSTLKNTLWKVAIDLSAGFLIILFYIYFKHPNIITAKNILLGAFVSIFPDLVTFLYWQMKIKFLKKPYEFHTWLHKYPPFSEERNFTLRNGVNDIIISLIAIIFLLF